MADTLNIPKAAVTWIISRDTGISSETIWAHMVGVEPRDRSYNYPHDPADLGRCLRLLQRIPEWRPRIGEMSARGPVWAALVARWDDLEASMVDEVGIDYSKAARAPKTYELMRSIIEPVEDEHRLVIRIGARK